MSSFLCFLCHSTVNADTNEDTREKYREVVGMHLCPDSHLCYICCHVLNKLWLFRSICLKRSLEYPVLFREKGTINLQQTDCEVQTLCPEELCGHHTNRLNNFNTYQYNDCSSEGNNDYIENNGYVEFDRNYFDQHNDKEKIITETQSKQELQNPELVNNVNINNDLINTENTYSNYDSVSLEDVNKTQAEVATESDNDIDECNDGIVMNIDEDNEDNVTNDDNKSVKEHNGFIKITKTLEEQKAELEANRKKKKYLEAEFKCYNCALGFLLKDTYQAHMMRHEESNGEYQCKVCTLRFGSSSGERHHRSVHAARFLCACGLSVPTARVAAHRRKCVGDLPACHACGKQFADKSSLARHIKRFHAPPSTKIYSCSICGDTFNNPAGVRSHMIKHVTRKFPCPHCPVVLCSPSSARAHIMRHEPATSVVPCACGASFSSLRALKDHRARSQAHQDTRYKCNICGRCYTKDGLASHIRRVHGDKPRKKARITNKPAICYKCGISFQNNSKLNRHLKTVCEKEQLDDPISQYYEQ